MSVCEEVSLYSGPLKGHLCVQQPFVSPDAVSAGFCSQVLSGLLFLALVLCAGEPCVGLGPLDPWGNFYSREIPPDS